MAGWAARHAERGCGLSDDRTPSDEEVVRRVLAGDTEVYGVLVHRYRDRYARYAARLLGSVDLAEDAVQDAFVRAYERLAQCRDRSRFAGWFFLILRNRCFAIQREAAPDRPLEGQEDHLASTVRADAGIEAAERQRALDRALMRLTVEQRERIVEGQPWAHIGELRPRGIGTVDRSPAGWPGAGHDRKRRPVLRRQRGPHAFPNRRL